LNFQFLNYSFFRLFYLSINQHPLSKSVITMASSTPTSLFGVELDTAVPVQDRVTMSRFWNAHQNGLRQGKVFYLLPKTLTSAMEAAGRTVENVAESLMYDEVPFLRCS
jgi:hypothetical protein